MGKATVDTRPIKIFLYISRVIVDYVRYSFFTYALLPTVGTLLFLFFSEPAASTTTPILQILSLIWPDGQINEADVLQFASTVSLVLFAAFSLLSFIIRNVFHRGLPTISLRYVYLYTIALLLGLFIGTTMVTILRPAFGWGFAIVISIFGIIALLSTSGAFLMMFLSRKISKVIDSLPKDTLTIEHPSIRG